MTKLGPLEVEPVDALALERLAGEPAVEVAGDEWLDEPAQAVTVTRTAATVVAAASRESSMATCPFWMGACGTSPRSTRLQP